MKKLRKMSPEGVRNEQVVEAIRGLRGNSLQPFLDLPKDLRDVVRELISNESLLSDSALLGRLWEEDFKRPPPTPRQFLEDPYYLGTFSRAIFPKWKNELLTVLSSGYYIWLLGGAIGIGKTTVSLIALLYKICRLCLMHDPAGFYGLWSGSRMVFGLFNVFKYRAEDVDYDRIRRLLKNSPFFCDLKFTVDDEVDRYLGLPSNIGIAVGASAVSVFGEDLFGGLLDEANFGKEGDARRLSIEEDQMFFLFQQSLDRSVSRFGSAAGGIPGLFCLASSAREEKSFMDVIAEKLGNKRYVYESRYSLWDVKPETGDDNKVFWVVVGDGNRPSVVTKRRDRLPEGTDRKIVSVPMRFWDRFEFDTDSALRDLAGVSTHGKSKLVPPGKLYQCIDNSREHPFSVMEAVLGVDSDVSLSDYFLTDAILRKPTPESSRYKPVYYPESYRSIHVDLALNKCAAGIAATCEGGLRQVETFKGDVKTVVKRQTYFIDFMLRIVNPPGDEIDLGKVVDFILYLRSIGYPIRSVSFDRFESGQPRQTLRKAGFQRVLLRSVDGHPEYSGAHRDLICYGLISTYPYEPYEEEVGGVITLPNGKIDKPRGGSKDLWDAVTGSLAEFYDDKKVGSAEPRLPPATDRLRSADDLDKLFEN